MQVALITGINGQDGSYLAEFLLGKNYQVYGIIRRASVFNTQRIDHIFNHPRLHLKHGDLTDFACIVHILESIKQEHPNRKCFEIYNLAAQSHVQVSFEVPLYTSQVDAIGTLNMIEAIRVTGLIESTRFYQASTSELYGKVLETPQNESTPFNPQSPYAVAKMYSHYIVKNYREAYGLFGCCGILFNHSGPRRGKTFVGRKITLAVANIHRGKQKTLKLGNLEAKRDWGDAEDYVRAMWMMLQQPTADDYVIATGETHSVREFVEKSFAVVGIHVVWRGSGLDEIGVNSQTNEILVEIDPKYFRPSEVDLLLGDAAKAHQHFGWTPSVTFDQLVVKMVENDLLSN